MGKKKGKIIQANYLHKNNKHYSKYLLANIQIVYIWRNSSSIKSHNTHCTKGTAREGEKLTCVICLVMKHKGPQAKSPNVELTLVYILHSYVLILYQHMHRLIELSSFQRVYPESVAIWVLVHLHEKLCGSAMPHIYPQVQQVSAPGVVKIIRDHTYNDIISIA